MGKKSTRAKQVGKAKAKDGAASQDKQQLPSDDKQRKKQVRGSG